MVNLYSKVFVLFLLLFLLADKNINSQSHSQIWPTIEMTGKVNKDLDLKFKYRNKYDFEEGESTASWVNFGISYDRNIFNVYYSI